MGEISVWLSTPFSGENNWDEHLLCYVAMLPCNHFYFAEWLNILINIMLALLMTLETP